MKTILNISITLAALLVVSACSSSNIESSKKDTTSPLKTNLLEKESTLMEQVKKEDSLIEKYIPSYNYEKNPVHLLREIWGKEASFCIVSKIPVLPDTLNESNEKELMFEIFQTLSKETKNMPKRFSNGVFVDDPIYKINPQIHLTTYIYNYYREQEIESIKEIFKYKKSKDNFLLEVIASRVDIKEDKVVNEFNTLYEYNEGRDSCAVILQKLDNGYLVVGDLTEIAKSVGNSGGYGAEFARRMLLTSDVIFIETEVGDDLIRESTLPNGSFYLFIGEKTYLTDLNKLRTVNSFKKLSDSYIRTLLEGKLFLRNINDIFYSYSFGNNTIVGPIEYEKFKEGNELILSNENLANKNDSNAQIEVACGYLKMNNYIKAKEWADKSIKNGNNNAYYVLGRLCENQRQIENAIKNYEKAAEAGFSTAQYNLGRIFHLNAHFTSEDDAIYWYEKAVAQNNKSAMNNLANIYVKKYHYYKDTREFYSRNWGNYNKSIEYKEKAIALYTKGEAMGDEVCSHNLGKFYSDNRNSEYDLKKAQEHYLIAANKGYLDSIKILANLYRNGQKGGAFGLGSVKKDPKKAEYWYCIAANKGDLDSIKALAEFYKGDVFEKDLEKARYWRLKLNKLRN